MRVHIHVERLAGAIERAGGPAKVAEATDLARQTVYNAQTRGRHEIKLDTAVRICAATGLRLEELVEVRGGGR